MLAALAGKASPGLSAMAGNVLGTKSTGALFVEFFTVRRAPSHSLDRFNLQRVDWARYEQDARKILGTRTDVAEDRKSGVISITVTDENRNEPGTSAQGYVEELDRLVSQVGTSWEKQTARAHLHSATPRRQSKLNLKTRKNSSARSPAKIRLWTSKNKPSNGRVGGCSPGSVGWQRNPSCKAWRRSIPATTSGFAHPGRGDDELKRQFRTARRDQHLLAFRCDLVD